MKPSSPHLPNALAGKLGLLIHERCDRHQLVVGKLPHAVLEHSLCVRQLEIHLTRLLPATPTRLASSSTPRSVPLLLHSTPSRVTQRSRES